MTQTQLAASEIESLSVGNITDLLAALWPSILMLQLLAWHGFPMGDKLSADEKAAFEAECLRLREEHRDLDAAIEALHRAGPVDQLQLARLKKRKLILRDRISFLEDQLTPDIIA